MIAVKGLFDGKNINMNTPDLKHECITFEIEK